MKLILMLIAFACSSAVAMVKGTPAGSPYLQSTVLIIFGQSNRCTGVIVGPRHVLTANHCMMADASTYQVLFTSDLTPVLQGKERVQSRGVAKILRPPTLHAVDGLSDDLALLELIADVPAGYVPATVPAKELEISAGTSLTSLGFGLQNSIGLLLAMAPSENLKRPWEPVRLDQKTFQVSLPAQELFKGIHLQHHRLFFEQRDGGVCMGDSGGPVFLEIPGQAPLLIAVNGATVPLFNASEPADVCASSAFVTRVDTSLEWLRSVVPSL